MAKKAWQIPCAAVCMCVQGEECMTASWCGGRGWLVGGAWQRVHSEIKDAGVMIVSVLEVHCMVLWQAGHGFFNRNSTARMVVLWASALILPSGRPHDMDEFGAKVKI